MASSLTPASAEVRPICFPVLDPVTYTDTFGAPRGGGRTHEGIDLMGEKMHRLVSAVDGVVVDVRGPGGQSTDHGVRIRGDDGYYYAYLHMNDDTPGTDDGLATWDQVFAPNIANGARVRAGQLVGYLGDSGNAEDAGPHLHFEMRTPASTVWQSTAVNPYDSLRAARRCAPLTSPSHPYTALGGYTDAAPDSASPGTGILDAFVRGGDDQLWHRAWVGGFTEWMPLGGALRSGPAATSPHPGRVDVFVRGRDDQLWQRTRIDGGWGTWVPLGGALTSDPDATSSGNGDIAVAARGRDDSIWYRVFDGAAWSDWTPAGGLSPSGPGVASLMPGHLALYVRGNDDVLWSRTLSAGAWAPWQSVGGLLSEGPDAATEGGSVHVAVRGTDHRLWYLDHGAGGAWTSISREAAGSAPSIVSWGPDRLDVWAAGTDGALYQTWWTGAGW